MLQRRWLDLPRPAEDEPGGASEPPIASRIDCLERILRAFGDIADRDDIHQAALRLASVQDWIRREADAAAADPIFRGLRLV